MMIIGEMKGKELLEKDKEHFKIMVYYLQERDRLERVVWERVIDVLVLMQYPGYNFLLDL